MIGQVALFDAELVGAKVAQFRGLHSIFSCENRVANFVMIGSFVLTALVWACVLVVIWLGMRGELGSLRRLFSNPTILSRLFY